MRGSFRAPAPLSANIYHVNCYEPSSEIWNGPCVRVAGGWDRKERLVSAAVVTEKVAMPVKAGLKTV